MPGRAPYLVHVPSLAFATRARNTDLEVGELIIHRGGTTICPICGVRRTAAPVSWHTGRRPIMTEQDLIEVAKEAVEAFNKDDWGQAMAVLGGSLYNELGTGRQLRGEAQILPALQGWKKAM